MTPVCFYIDGLNLYHALAKFGDNRVKWLDLYVLSHRLISPKSEKISSIFYFSAFAHWLPDKMARHQVYVKALEATGVTCILGHFKNKSRKCNSCGAIWTAHEEKETDVRIGDQPRERRVQGTLRQSLFSDPRFGLNARCADGPCRISDKKDRGCRTSSHGPIQMI
jgi:hypothetical protein